MKILFGISQLFYAEPLGAMQLSAICKAKGHQTKLVVLSRESILPALKEFQPDIIGYSVMSADEELFEEADLSVRKFIEDSGKPIIRIMGGPHPTYFPEVLEKFGLDAIVRGDGDNALSVLLDRIEAGSKDFSGIPNTMSPDSPDFQSEVVTDMDSLPYNDRSLIYDYDPEFLKVGIRSFLTQRGCPYKCTYCFNHTFNEMFIKGKGVPLLRRCSVDRLIAEIKDVVARYPVVRFIRFSDDVFVIRKDAWLEEFSEKYAKEIGLPFYCLLRPNGLHQDVLELLAKAGCKSICASTESGVEEVRRVVLKRKMPAEVIIDGFARARKLGINIHANSIGVVVVILRRIRFTKDIKNNNMLIVKYSNNFDIDKIKNIFNKKNIDYEVRNINIDKDMKNNEIVYYLIYKNINNFEKIVNDVSKLSGVNSVKLLHSETNLFI